MLLLAQESFTMKSSESMPAGRRYLPLIRIRPPGNSSPFSSFSDFFKSSEPYAVASNGGLAGGAPSESGSAVSSKNSEAGVTGPTIPQSASEEDAPAVSAAKQGKRSEER